MIPKKVLKFLEEKKIKFKILEHRTVYSAIDKSKTLKISPSSVVKTIFVRGKKKFGLVLVSGDKILDLKKFSKVFGEKAILAKESLIKKKFKGVKIGSIPPFGDLWNLPVFLDKSLERKKELVVSSGDYNFSFKISPKELRRGSSELKIGVFAKKKTK